MKCEDMRLGISEYIDEMLNEEESKQFQEHLMQCEECNIYYQNFKMMIESLNEIDLVEPPNNFNEELHKKLVKEKTSILKGVLAYKKPIMAVAAVLLVAVITIPTIGNLTLGNGKRYGTKSANDLAMEDRASYGHSQEEASFDISSNKLFPPAIVDVGENNFSVLEMEDTGELPLIQEEVSDRKIIRNGRLTLEVESFDQVYTTIIRDVENNSGFIQSSEVYNYYVNRERPNETLKSANIVIRIPNHRFLDMFEGIKTLGKATDEAISGTDITDKYIDIENEIYNLRIQEERLREILKKADKVEDILKIENELNRVRGSINRLDSSLTDYDKLVSFSTINLYIRQIKSDQVQINTMSTGLMSKAKNSFIDSVNKVISVAERIFVGFFAALPIILIITILGVPVWIFIKKKKNESNM